MSIYSTYFYIKAMLCGNPYFPFPIKAITGVHSAKNSYPYYFLVALFMLLFDLNRHIIKGNK